MLNPLPTMAQAYSLLLQKEKQREMQANTHFLADSASLYASGNRNNHYRSNQYNNQYNNQAQLRNGEGRKPLFCNFCKRNGHTEDKCYKKHGHPDRGTQNFVERGPPGNRFAPYNQQRFKGKQIAVAVHSGQEFENIPSTSSGVPGLTPDQYQQLIHMMNGTHISQNSNNENSVMTAANFAGITSCVLSSSNSSNGNCTCLTSYLTTSNPWILDPGASEHMTYDKSLFLNLTLLHKPHLITLPNGYKVEVEYAGSVFLLSALTLHNVLLVPAFKYHLLSIQKLCIQLSCTVMFIPTACVMQGPSLKRPLQLVNKTVVYIC